MALQERIKIYYQTYQNLLQDLRKSSTAQSTATEICDGSLSGKPNKKIRSNSKVLPKAAICQTTQHGTSFSRALVKLNC